MTSSGPARTAAHRNRSTILIATAVVAAVVIGAFGYQSSATSPSSEKHPEPIPAPGPAPPPQAGGGLLPAPGRPPPPTRVRQDRGASGLADGAVPDGVSVFDDEFPAVANLDPDLLGALRRAAPDAARDGVGLTVNSGWRSRDYQNQLLREAISEYGSEEEAARWVATADTSPHVSGNAIDIGPSEATAWLSENGAEYGLCQIYGNEPWHYELRPEAVDDGCPSRYADPTHDPRMQR